jgi:hypothetical protein
MVATGFLGEDGRSNWQCSKYLRQNYQEAEYSLTIPRKDKRIGDHAGSRGRHVPASRRRPGVHLVMTPDILAA